MERINEIDLNTIEKDIMASEDRQRISDCAVFIASKVNVCIREINLINTRFKQYGMNDPLLKDR